MSNFMSNFIGKILLAELYSNFKVAELELEHKLGDLDLQWNQEIPEKHILEKIVLKEPTIDWSS